MERKHSSHPEIFKVLLASFDTLDEEEKCIFLDIACFFKGEQADFVQRIMDGCGFSASIGISVLADKCLVTITENTLEIHDLLQEMGREIVRKESRNEPGKRSRIWLHDDFNQVIMNDSGMEQIEGIVLNELLDQPDEKLSAKAILKMKKLRLLKVQNLQFSQDIAYLSNELAYLNWYGCPFKYFSPAFQPNKLVELHLQKSSIQYLWKTIRPVKSLKIVNLSYSKNLIKTPDFKDVPNLEHLNLQGCVGLLELHESIGALEKLVSLNLKDCKKLASLSTSTCNLKSLKILNLSGCSGLFKFLGTLGFSKCLEELDVAGIGIIQWLLTGIKGFLQPFWSTPKSNPLYLPNLVTLTLSGTNLTDQTIPKDWSCFPLLELLDLSGNGFSSIPPSIYQLSRLSSLHAANCERLQSLPSLPSSMEDMNLKGCISLESLPDLFPLSQLRYLEFGNCKSLQSVPPLPSSVKRLTMENCTSLQTLPIVFDKFKLCSEGISFYTGFSNCSKLNDNQDGVDMVSTWLESYLLWVTLTRRLMKDCYNQCAKFCNQGCLNPPIRLPDFLTCFPGSAIPTWFTHQNLDGTYLEIQLSPDENFRNIAGFAVCAVVESSLDSQLDWLIKVRSKKGLFKSWGNQFAVREDSALRFDHLSIFFVVDRAG